MNFKTILKAVGLVFLSSQVLAENGDCGEIENYLNSMDINYAKTILDCSVDDSGKVTTL